MKMIEMGIDDYSQRIRNAAQMNARRWSVPGAVEFDENVNNLREFMEQRITFLDDIWIREIGYYTVEILIPGNVTTSYAIHPGEKLPDLPFTDGEWCTVENDEHFDITKPIYADAIIYRK